MAATRPMPTMAAKSTPVATPAQPHRPAMTPPTLNRFSLAKTSQELFDSREDIVVKPEPIKPRNFAEVVAKKTPALAAHTTNVPLNRTPINLNSKTIISNHKSSMAAKLTNSGFGALTSAVSLISVFFKI